MRLIAFASTGETIGDYRANLRRVFLFNGRTMQASSTAHMIFSIPQLIAYLSCLMTLEPGDLILTGTPPGVCHARKPPVYFQPGDTMRAETDGVGVVENRVFGG